MSSVTVSESTSSKSSETGTSEPSSVISETVRESEERPSSNLPRRASRSLCRVQIERATVTTFESKEEVEGGVGTEGGDWKLLARGGGGREGERGEDVEGIE